MTAIPKPFSVLFVCTANICRSPTAHGVFQQRVQAAGLADRVAISSAGTHQYHVGSPPDPRAVYHAAERGYDLSALRARAVRRDDFTSQDLILALDVDHLDWLRLHGPTRERHRIELLTRYSQRLRSDGVPDPYGGDAAAFEHVLDLVEDACDGLLAEVQTRLAARP